MLDPDVIEARRRKAEADQQFDDQLAVATTAARTRMLLAEMTRRQVEALELAPQPPWVGFRGPRHCDQCFEGCPKCQG
jgi:hypothetical protein